MLLDPTYCPVCGTALEKQEIGGRERPTCPNCGYVHFVNPVPGVGMVIEKDDGVVLIKRGNPPHKGEWTLPSGFVEADESAEEAAIREAEEETGLKVEIIELANINSFPEGPPVSGIMIFYRMRPVGGTLQAGDDADEVRVFQPESMPLLPFRTHREMMAEWLDRYADITGQRTQAHQPDIHIRPYAPRDTDEVISLLATIPANRETPHEKWAEVVLRLREASTIEVYVAETGTQTPIIIGFVALSVVRGLMDGVGLISNMAVLPTYQRRGVGAALLEEVMRRATQLNLRAVWVDQTRANDQARAFYAALGFEDHGVLRLKLR